MHAGAPDWFCRVIEERPDQSRVDVDGVTVSARCWGPVDVPGVVLVHGGAAHAGWWDALGPLLARRRRVVAVDLSGHGDSGRRSSYHLSAWADEVVAQAEAAGIAGPPVVVGHSMGGYVALTCGREHSSAVSGVVVLDSPVPAPEPEPELVPARAGRARRGYYPSREAALARFRVIPADPYALPFVLDHVAEASVVQHGDGWTWKFDPVAMDRDRTIPMSLLHDQRGRVAIFRAEHGLLSPEVADCMAKTMANPPRAVVALPGTGHHVILDDPLAVVVGLDTLLSCWATEDHDR